MKTEIYCCGCERDVLARYVGGAEIYPDNYRLRKKKFYLCDDCGNYVGAKYGGTPLGVIATAEIRSARIYVHRMLDPIWQTGRMTRTQIYKRVSAELGYQFHTANITSVQEAHTIYNVIKRCLTAFEAEQKMRSNV